MENEELIVYPVLGVCRVQGIREMEGQKGLYRALSPVSDPNTTVFIPLDSQKAHLRPVMSRETALALIRRLPELQTVSGGSLNERKQRYSEMLKSGDPVQLAQLGKTVYLLQLERSRSGKNACSFERSAMRESEKLLYGELAAALSIRPAEVPGFIEQQLQGGETENISSN